MKPRRSFYTRQQVAAYCGVSIRTVVRWEGSHLTKRRDPRRPHRVVYSGTEVESWERRRRRRREYGSPLARERAPRAERLASSQVDRIILLIPAAFSISRDEEEWHVLVLDDETLARMRLRRDLSEHEEPHSSERHDEPPQLL